MRELSPHNSSFFSSLYKQSPYNDWLQYASTYKEFNDLLKIFHYVPQTWLEWVDDKILNQNKQGLEINNQLKYRISLLNNGVILLQEGKYICDIVENALRQIVICNININNPTYTFFKRILPDWEDTFSRYKYNNRNVQEENVVDISFIISLSFYQIIEIIYRLWKDDFYFPQGYISGHGNYFRRESRCRDRNEFKKDMTSIRRKRNIIAHSKHLLIKDDVQMLYRKSNKWLLPLDISLSDKIVQYRSQRPNFLSELLINNYIIH